MTEAEWLACESVDRMLELLRGNASQRQLRLFAVGCCRLISEVSTGENNRAALVIAERFAEESATQRELRSAYQSAWAGAEGYAPDECVAFTVHRYAFRAASRAAFWSRVVGGVIADNAATQDERTRARADAHASERAKQGQLLHELLGNPFRPVTFSPAWRTSTAVALASQMYASRDFAALPILADALQGAGCFSADVLDHCRGPGPHVRGCWVVDLVLGKE
jgi:hypothetical protein